MTLDRRRFLQLTTAGIVVSLTSSACAGDGGEDIRALARPELLSMLGAERVRELGVHYRAAVPKENTTAALRAAIIDGGHRGLRFPWTPRPSMEQQVRDDFAAGQTVLVQGWVLSATEARQCALFSLVSA
ncbi:MAG: hypothetical protein H0T48_13745 [Gemmatimonadaceae bacterium]|nr:hypothetical protein [Gemmatimonadaceae bacterium]